MIAEKPRVVGIARYADIALQIRARGDDDGGRAVKGAVHFKPLSRAYAFGAAGIEHTAAEPAFEPARKIIVAVP